MSSVHPTAVVDEGATLGANVTVGPYCVVGGDAVLGDQVVLHSHVVIAGRTTIGRETEVYPFASLGHPPQDVKYAGEASELIIGERNVIREHVTMNPGTSGGGMVTRVGNDGLFLTASHVGHDSLVGDHVIFSNNATVAGHVTVGDWVILSGLTAVHQFVRIGQHAFVGGMSGVENDIIPFGTALGNRAQLAGLNIIGLKRRGYEREQIHALRAAYRLLFAEEGTLRERIDDVAGLFADNQDVMAIVDFMRADADRSLCTPRPDKQAA